MTGAEVPLTGGALDARPGRRHARRPIGPWTPTIHALLRHGPANVASSWRRNRSAWTTSDRDIRTSATPPWAGRSHGREKLDVPRYHLLAGDGVGHGPLPPGGGRFPTGRQPSRGVGWRPSGLRSWSAASIIIGAVQRRCGRWASHGDHHRRRRRARNACSDLAFVAWQSSRSTGRSPPACSDGRTHPTGMRLLLLDAYGLRDRRHVGLRIVTMLRPGAGYNRVQIMSKAAAGKSGLPDAISDNGHPVGMDEALSFLAEHGPRLQDQLGRGCRRPTRLPPTESNVGAPGSRGTRAHLAVKLMAWYQPQSMVRSRSWPSSNSSDSSAHSRSPCRRGRAAHRPGGSADRSRSVAQQGSKHHRG